MRFRTVKHDNSLWFVADCYHYINDEPFKSIDRQTLHKERNNGHIICYMVDEVDPVRLQYLLRVFCHYGYLENNDRIYMVKPKYEMTFQIDRDALCIVRVDDAELLMHSVFKYTCQDISQYDGFYCIKPYVEPMIPDGLTPNAYFCSRAYQDILMGAEYIGCNTSSAYKIPVKYKWKLWAGMTGVGLTEDDKVVNVTRTFQEWIDEIRSLYLSNSNRDIEAIKSKIEQIYQLPESSKPKSKFVEEMIKDIDDARASNSAFLSLIDKTLELLGG